MGPSLALNAGNTCILGSMGKSDHSILMDGILPQLLLSQTPSAGMSWTLTFLSGSSLIHTHELALWFLSYNSSPTVCWVQLLALTCCVSSRTRTHFYCVYHWGICVASCMCGCQRTSLWGWFSPSTFTEAPDHQACVVNVYGLSHLTGPKHFLTQEILQVCLKKCGPEGRHLLCWLRIHRL